VITVKTEEHSADLSWHWQKLEEMQPRLIYELLAFRESVFVVEQACPYQELDGRDLQAWHLLGQRSGHILACLRVLPPPASSKRYRIGRVAVEEAARGKGFAKDMLVMAELRIAEHAADAEIVLDAQTYLLPFYQALGYSVSGDEFLEDDIPHVPMQKSLQAP
jgi:ElaA protein